MGNPFSFYIERGDFVQVSGSAGRSGPEYHGACPICHAGAENGRKSDQFVCFPAHPHRALSGGGWFCRNCTDGKLKSGVDFLIARDGITVREAFKALGLQSAGGSFLPRVRRIPSTQRLKPDPVKLAHGVADAELWTAAARAFLLRSQKALAATPVARDYLRGRGFTDESIRLYGFGYNPKTERAERTAWGLNPVEDKKLWLPRGWVIPLFDSSGKELLGLKIRRPQIDIKRTEAELGKSIKYVSIKRSSAVPVWLSPAWSAAAPVLVFEGELDAALVHQEGRGCVNTLSTGSTSNPIPEDVLGRMAESLVYVVMDADKAGAAAAEKYEKAFPDWESVPPPVGYKDAGEAFEHGESLADWMRGFLPSYLIKQLEPLTTSPAESSPCEPSIVGSSSSEDEAGPDEFAAHVEQVRGAWPDGPPMIAQDMPDWRAFCAGYPDVCGQCPYYDGNPNGSPCTLWEAAFHGVVRWYPPTN